MDWIALSENLEEYLTNGNIAYCIEFISEHLKLLDESPFQLGIHVDFTNNPTDIANVIGKLLQSQKLMQYMLK